MNHFVPKRILHSSMSPIGLIPAIFFVAHLIGNPASLYLPSDASVEIRQEFAERHGYNDPIIEQFGRDVGGVSRLDFGNLFREQRPAVGLVLEALEETLFLTLATMVLAIALTQQRGAIVATRQGRMADRAITFASLATVPIRTFFAQSAKTSSRRFFSISW